MNFDTWEPVYERILADFGFDRAADERARDVLADLVSDATDSFDSTVLDHLSGSTVAIAGAGPSLSADIDRARDADAVVAASLAADTLAEAGIDVDLMVSDLDKNPGTGRDLTRSGVPVAVHAHGDNVPAVREWVPEYDAGFVLPTTQAEPVGSVRNFGGFTDGDRAAFIADAFDAAELIFVGWDFDDPTVDPMKAKKLRWAERLLYWLEVSRDERFDVLEGRRDDLERVWV